MLQTLARSFCLHLFLDSLVAPKTAKRKLRLRISILVWIGTRWTSTILTPRRITEFSYHSMLRKTSSSANRRQAQVLSKITTKTNYLQGLLSNKLGRPISSGKITVVPVGPITHLMVLDASAKALAAFSWIKYTMSEKIEFLAFYSLNEEFQYLCQFFLALLYFVFLLFPAWILAKYFSNSLLLHNSIKKNLIAASRVQK